MDQSHKEEFIDAIGTMLTVFGAEANKTVYTGYWIGLRDLTLDQTQQAVSTAIRTCTFLPKPAELREIVLGDSDERGMQAWTTTLDAVQRLGPYKHVDFQDRTINAVVRNLGGWPTFCERFSGAEAEKWTRIEFLKAYQALEHCNGSVCEPLPGLSQACVVDGQLAPPQPKRIGCSYLPAIGQSLPALESSQ